MATGSIELAADKVKNGEESVADKYIAAYYGPLAIAQTVLGGLIGTYGLIKQNELANKYFDLAREQVDQAQEIVDLSKNNYNQISLPTFTCQKSLFDRYKAEFMGFEGQYLADAFKYDEFAPDYLTQEGRAVANVGAQFDRAQLNRRRSTGKYNSGRSCSDATQFAIEQAKARTAASDFAYRFEEQRKFRFDQWYWSRRSAGASYVDGMRAHVISGVNGGASVANSGFGNIIAASGGRANAFQAIESAVSFKGNIFGSIANFGFQNFGQGLGAIQSGGLLLGQGGNIPSNKPAGVDSMVALGNAAVSPFSLRGVGQSYVGSFAAGLSTGPLGESRVVNGNTLTDEPG